MKTPDKVAAVIALTFLLAMAATIVHALTKGVALMNRLEAGYEANYQLDVIAQKCVHSGYGPGRSSTKIYICDGTRTMKRGPSGFMILAN